MLGVNPIVLSTFYNDTLLYNTIYIHIYIYVYIIIVSSMYIACECSSQPRDLTAKRCCMCFTLWMNAICIVLDSPEEIIPSFLLESVLLLGVQN